MAQNGAIGLKMATLDSTGSNWLQSAPKGTKLLHMAPNGSTRLEKTPNGSKRLQRAPNGSTGFTWFKISIIWVKMAPNCSNWLNMALNWLQMILNYFKLFQIAPRSPKGSNWRKYASRGSKWLKWPLKSWSILQLLEIAPNLSK